LERLRKITNIINSDTVFRRKPEGKRPPDKHRHRWKYNIWMGFKKRERNLGIQEYEVLDWIKLV
jgi:hypothetical protein